MGSNCSSSDNSDDELHPEDNNSDVEGETEKEISGALDIGNLFEATTLRILASKVKDDIPENVVQQHSAALVRWLEEKLQQNEETVTLSQFYDVLMNRSVGRDDCLQAFQQFDSEGDGTADAATMLEVLKSSSSTKVQEETAHVVRTIQACSLLAGFIDVYNEDKGSIGQHGTRLLNFILRNRAPTLVLPFPILNGFNNTTQMRLTTLDNFFSKLKETASRQEETLLHDGEEIRPIDKCFSLVDVSTNKADAYRMFNKDFASYWQSDGSARSHWIRLKMKSNVVVKQLSVGVAGSDQSYMPNLITVAVGKSAFNLREIKEIRVPSHTTGDVVLVEDLKVFYPIVQINIKRCQSDGCDTRIHHCKILGYRIVKESGVSVTDASAAWYLQIMASTALASLPVTPQLRNTIIQQTQEALRHMPPLSLSPSSNDRPSFMSTHVLKEIDKFLTSIVHGDGNISKEGLAVLLTFNLARGHVAATLNTIIQIQQHIDMEIGISSLVSSINKVRDTFWKRQGGTLQLRLAGCDGGKKEEVAGPNNVVGANWSTSQAYLSGDGKTQVNMFFEGADHVQITKIRIKVDKGPRGPRCGMVFVYKLEEKFNLEEQTKRFSEFDGWRTIQYNFCNAARTAGITKKEDIPVAYFNIEDDWDEVEVIMDACQVGKYVLIKFLEPRQASAERLGIVGIKFYGFHRKAIFMSNQDVERLMHSDESDNKKLTGKVILPKVMSFLTLLSRDQDTGDKRSLSTRPHNIDMSNLSIGLIWKLYNGFDDHLCKVLSLELLHSLFPFLSNSKNQNRDNAEEFFQHLCSLVDARPESSDNDINLHLVAKQVIIDGAAVFFPDKEARRKQLFNMMSNSNVHWKKNTSKAEISNDIASQLELSGASLSLESGDQNKEANQDPVSEPKQVPETPQETLSVTLTFQSLCQFFSSVDPSGLLDLPNTITQDFNEEPVLQVLETLVSVAYREFHKVLDTDDQTEQSSHLVQLLCSLQTSLLAWAHRQITTDNKEHGKIAQKMLVRYVNLLSAKVIQALNEYSQLSQDAMINLMNQLENSFLSTVLRQMVLIMTMLTDKLSSPTRTKILHEMLSISKELQKIAPSLPQVFYKLDSEAWKAMESGEVILRTWEVESPHNYDNNMHTKQIFTCPGASSFIVEFDARCETEKRYDYLEFTDSRGIKMRFDQKVGTEKWPVKLTLHGGHRLQFLFHSDSSNNEWGYKFKVLAKGCPDVPLSWLFDLQLSLTKLAGRLSGAILDVNQVLPKAHSTDAAEEAESDLFKSELWTTLFRGGYKIGKLQRSLSGKHTAEDSIEVIGFLLNLSESSEEETLADKFYKRCEENSKSLSPNLGGEQVDAAIRAVFAALIWHSQQLREDIEKYVRMEGECKLTEGSIQAFNTAESLRLYFAEQRQKQKVSADKTGESDLFDSVAACTEKALFLLKFAGLSKVHMKSENKSKHDRKSKLHNRIQLQTGEKIFKLDIDRHPSFRLVLDFVRDPAWSKQRVEQLLQQRCEQAQAVSEVYMLSAEFIRITAEEHIFQIPTVVFLQELFSYQDKFAKHYADGLDGCGLILESKVRRSYYTLVRRMVDSVRALNRLKISRSLVTCYDFMVACTLHLLDVNWQLHDLFLLVDLKLPELYIKLAKGSVSMRENIVSDVNKEKELEEYKQNMKWHDECNNTTFSLWYNKYQKESIEKDKKKAVQMFVARFCDLLDVEISCDGCTETLPGRRYRCLQCMDMDLCSTCFAGGVKPDGEHTDEHEIVHLQYKCDECYAFIVGTRIHCNNCENFDLCLGCHEACHFPAGHSNEHNIETYPMIKWKTNQKADSSVMSYIHQHVWLLYCSLALSMANLLYQNNATSPGGKYKELESSNTSLDPDYIKAATQLYNASIELSVQCLMQTSMPDDVDTDNDDSPEAMESRQQEAFAIHSQERIMGLLGAMLPSDEKTPLAEDVSLIFFNFLDLLFYIASGESEHETNTQHFALGLIGRLLERTSTQCQVVDSAVALAQAKRKALEEKTNESSLTPEDAKKPSGTKIKSPRVEWKQLFDTTPPKDEVDHQKPMTADDVEADSKSEELAQSAEKKSADDTSSDKQSSDKESCAKECSEQQSSDKELLDAKPQIQPDAAEISIVSSTESEASKAEPLSVEGATASPSPLNTGTVANSSDPMSVKQPDDQITEPSKDAESEPEPVPHSVAVDKSDNLSGGNVITDSSESKTPEVVEETNGSSVDPPMPPTTVQCEEIKPTVNSSHDVILSSILRKTQSVEKLDELNRRLTTRDDKANDDHVSIQEEESPTVAAATEVDDASKQADLVVCAAADDTGAALKEISAVVKGHSITDFTTEGHYTADYLFSFGATCLERSGLDWANSMAAIISKLFNAPTWRDVLLKHLSSLIDNLKQNAELSSIFALFVVAGFPEVLSIGSHVRFMDIGTEMKEGFVLKHFPDKSHTLLVDKKSRKRRMVKDEYVECLYEDIQILDEHHIAAFIQLITTITARIQSGESVGVANMWVLSLTLKALSKTFVSDKPEHSEQLFSEEFVRCVVYLASQGTGFSKQWLLKHLEILSLFLYTHDHEDQDSSKILVVDSTPADKIADKENCPPEESGHNPWEGLDDTTKLCFQTLHEHLNVPVSVLRAIYDHHNKNTNALLMEVHDNIEGISFTPSDDIVQMAKKWESAATSSVELAADKAVDTGVQLLALPTENKKPIDEAEEEPTEVLSCSVPMVDNDIRNNTQKQRRTKSSSLLKKELETQGKLCSKDFLVKVNMAMTVLYARQVLTALLAYWPMEGRIITAQLLGCKHSSHIPFVLDLLHRPEARDMFQKVVQNLIKHCEPEDLVPIAMTACQFMEEVNLSTITKESEHNYKNNSMVEDKIHIPGAPFLAIKFDSRCCTEESSDELIMSSSPDFKADKHVFSGQRDKWTNFDMPGETLYYKFTSDCLNNDWGFRFTVTGGRMGRFDTGYMVLSAVLVVPAVIRSVPLDKLWHSLVYVACKQTGQQRLKALQLMLKLIQAHFRKPGVQIQPLDLSLLRPLWLLYCKMTGDTSKGGVAPDGGILPDSVRALTELFIRAEDLAMDWNMRAEYAASLEGPEMVHKVAYQALMNVAAVSLAIGQTNTATSGFKALEDKLNKSG